LITDARIARMSTSRSRRTSTRARRVALGSLVTATSFRNPALLAKMADTIDEISGGRLILELGAGWNEVECHMFGFPFDHRVDRFAEAFTTISGLLRDGQIDFAGRYYAARECELRPRGPRPGRPPIMVGSRGLRMLLLTLPSVPIWNDWLCDTNSYPEADPPLVEPVDDVCRAVSRDPATLEPTVSISVDPSGQREFPPHRRLGGRLSPHRQPGGDCHWHPGVWCAGGGTSADLPNPAYTAHDRGPRSDP
jgi:alkanesulfonate monooxygenase SsuD/methylene tetrahydromethanopterin reductase-like flavin-dependent oxidoreductase (luciferase family)